MVLSHRAKFQLIINFFRVTMFFYRTIIAVIGFGDLSTQIDRVNNSKRGFLTLFDVVAQISLTSKTFTLSSSI